jgi:23S rRNA (adenine-N6)-dimethyltransferase
LVRSLVARAHFRSTDVVYEIGPGRGIITEALARECGRVVAIERDRQLAAILKQRFKTVLNVEVVTADVLDLEFPATPYKVFSNIPFNMTADLIRLLLHGQNPPLEAYLILQRQAAEKYSGSRRESQASLLVKPWYEFTILHAFQPSDFTPAPGVDVVLLKALKRMRPMIDTSDAGLYRQFIRYGFNRQRANLGKSYKKVFSHLQWKRLAFDLGFDVHAQPANLNFVQWLGVFQFFITGLKAGFVHKPLEMSALPPESVQPLPKSVGPRVNSQPWKNRKAKQAR